ncbi:hypothetical protein [Novosphingobium sp. TCA1]|uniref:Uncharacterized protein n=1 Tax=Novosphingobium pentaromativorans TaxID=205844 RepID=A0A2W5NJR1_9SPHN|nr:hypothetical protein [Novosphingobium sp. TCA1]PZQ53224.1 MAG: hypothetical protein DI555_17255 [Novosphingobium pentaromativorans]GFE73058.1 hypothetical protein NTCA1_07070 [Novosphingobium sp. TCA1]
MVDILALALSHGLLALAAWRLLFRPDLDEEVAREAPRADSTSRQVSGRKGAVRREMRWPGGSEDKGSGGGDSNDA